MHSAALAAADSILANWLPQAPAASRVALEQAQRLYTVQAVVSVLLAALCCWVACVIAIKLGKKAGSDKYSNESELIGGMAIFSGILGVVMFVVTIICIPDAAAFLFAGKAATVLRLVGKF